MTMPILPGFNPDPSICRVGEWYYLATSTFEYVPGVPIHRSRDLLTWELVGHALPAASSVNAPAAENASGGIYAPTLRFHDGRFWMVTTSIGSADRGQLIVHAEDPAGPWSEPVHVEGTVGIDPDLIWLADGTCLLTWCPFAPGIRQVRIDPMTGARLSEPIELWPPSPLADTEGPHLYQRDGWWYLLVAEGGTYLGHGVSVARSRSPHGPFEAHPANPVFSHRSSDHPVQAAGHADLVELADGSWAAVHLGIRRTGGYPGFHVNGRETFLVGVDWENGWPVFDDSRFDVPARDLSWDDAFAGPELDPRWVAAGVEPASVARASGGLDLDASREVDGSQQGSVLCVRVPEFSWEVEAEVVSGSAALSVRIDPTHWIAVEVVDGRARLRAVSAPFDQVLGDAPLEAGDVVGLTARPHGDRFVPAEGPDMIEAWIRRGERRIVLGEVDGRHVSTEVAGGFTGRMIGVEALGGPARLSRVSYRSVPR